MAYGLTGWCQHGSKKLSHKKISHHIAIPVAQYVEDDEADSLKVIELDCDTLSSEMLKTKNVVANPHYPNVVTYKSDEDVYLAYNLNEKDQWISVLTPFNNETDDIQCVNFDRKNNPEVVVRGEVSSYGGHGGTTDYIMMILNVDDKPKQIFKIIYGGSVEMFGNVNHKTTLNTYKRNIKISNQGIYLSPLSNKSVTLNETDIRSGKYIMKDGAIIRTVN